MIPLADNESRRPRLRDDHGATLVEAAFVLPILLWLFMAMFDFSLVELKQSQVNSASRDGARTGIINWQNADVGAYTGGACPTASTGVPVPSASYKAICASVLSRLAGATVTGITAACYKNSTTTLLANCATANVIEGLDTIQVTVTYTYQPVTPPGQMFLGTTHSFSTTTRMVIQ